MRRWMTAVLWLAAALPLSAQYNVKRLMEEGRRQLDMGYYVVAMQVFERIAAMKPHQYEAWYLSALCKYRLEDFKGAAEDGSRALALQPYIPDLFDLHAMAAMRLERYDSAAIDYTRALEIDDANRGYWYNRAYAIYMGRQCGGASADRLHPAPLARVSAGPMAPEHDRPGRAPCSVQGSFRARQGLLATHPAQALG